MAELVNCFDIKKGMTYKYENEFYECIDFKYYFASLSSRERNKIHVVARRLKKGTMVKQIFSSSDYIEPVIPKETTMTFMFDNGEHLCFMDTDTYDMIEVPIAAFEWEKNFLTTDLTVSCYVYENEILKIVLPDTVSLTLDECSEIDGSNAFKDAICETGLKIKVPIFVGAGEQIVASTSDGTYQGRA